MEFADGPCPSEMVVNSDIAINQYCIQGNTVYIYKGHANDASDAELVQLLRRKPKTTPELRTTQAFRKFFAGIQHDRLLRLLNQAYASLDDASREQKAQKRMRLMKGHTCTVGDGTETGDAVPRSV